MMKLLFSFLLLLLPILTNAAVPAWKIIPSQSSITFSATQNDAPVTGEFKTFAGEINFDPEQLSASNITIVVDMGSVTSSFGEIAGTLKTPDWFNTAVFPQAMFNATTFTKLAGNIYQANGTLTIRDKTIPIVLNFTLDQYSNTAAHVTGTTTLKRTQFGIGQGEWAKTDAVKDDVKVSFVLKALKK